MVYQKCNLNVCCLHGHSGICITWMIEGEVNGTTDQVVTLVVIKVAMFVGGQCIGASGTHGNHTN